MLSYQGNINYELKVNFDQSDLQIRMKTFNGIKTHSFSKVFVSSKLPPELIKKKKNCIDVFKMMKHRRNFDVDPVRGAITMILVPQTFIEEQVEQRINLQLQEEPSAPLQSCIDSASMKYENLQSLVEDLQMEKVYPMLSNDTLSKGMQAFNQQMQTKKQQFYQTVFKSPLKFYDYGDLLGEGKYRGEVKEETPHGVGILRWENGMKYIGEWKDGLMDGKGIMYLFNDTIETFLQMKNGNLIGKAIYHYDCGIRMEGMFTHNVQTGLWRIYKPTGSIIQEIGDRIQQKLRELIEQ